MLTIFRQSMTYRTTWCVVSHYSSLWTLRLLKCTECYSIISSLLFDKVHLLSTSIFSHPPLLVFLANNNSTIILGTATILLSFPRARDQKGYHNCRLKSYHINERRPSLESNLPSIKVTVWYYSSRSCRAHCLTPFKDTIYFVLPETKININIFSLAAEFLFWRNFYCSQSNCVQQNLQMSR